jgi:putative membrane protein
VPEPDPRIFFAAERTLLAWFRTALALMGLGFVMARFDIFRPGSSSLVAGSGMIAVSVGFIVAATRVYFMTVQRLNRGEPFRGHTSWLALALAGLLVVLGAALMVYLTF